MVALGTLGLTFGDFALVWQRIPIAHLPGRTAIAYACGAIELAAGLGLLARRMTRVASIVLFVFMLLWLVLLKLPAVIAVPTMEATWLGFGEIAVMTAGAWVLFAPSRAHITAARVLFIVALPMIGLAHFVYVKETAAMVPAWLPWRAGWAYLTGAGSLATALALTFRIIPRIAATLQTAMMLIITLLVWGLGIAHEPASRLQWTGFWISMTFVAGCWAIATTYSEET